METLFILLEKLLPLYGYILIGYIGGKFFKIRNDIVSFFLIYILIPLVIFNSAASTSLTVNILAIPSLFFILCCFASLIVYLISKHIWKDSTKNLLAFIAGTTNTGYFGFAVIASILGTENLYIAVLAVLGTTLYFHTIGFMIAAKGRHTTKESLIKLAKLPILYAFFIGLLLSSFGIHLPTSYTQVADILNHVYIVLGMMTVGLALAEIKKYTFDYKFIGISLAAKYLLWPASMLFVFFLDSKSFNLYDAHLRKILFFMSLLPVAVNIVPFAAYLKEDSEKAAMVVIITTLLALLIIPLVASII